jgi:hypothetical protein
LCLTPLLPLLFFLRVKRVTGASVPIEMPAE